MLTDYGLEALFDRLGTPEPGRNLVRRARKEAPVREVQSRLSNVITAYPSRKMARIIKTESRTVEYRAMLQYEFGTDFKEYYPQPTKLDLILTDSGTKKPFRTSHTPDFLLLGEGFIRIEEWREESRLLRYAEKYPQRYRKEDGIWRFPEVEAILGEMGIEYRLRSANEQPIQFIRNLEFLADYLSVDCPEINKAGLDALMTAFEERPVWPLSWLIDRTSEARGSDSGSWRGFTNDEIYKAIADGILIFDLERDDLAATNRVHVFRDWATFKFHRRIEEAERKSTVFPHLGAALEVGATLEYDGQPYEVILLSDCQAVIKGDRGTSEVGLDMIEGLFKSGRLNIVSPTKTEDLVTERLGSLPPKALDTALERAEILERAESNPNEAPCSLRTIQRYRQRAKNAGASAIDRHLALAPNHAAKGNRTRRLPQEVLDCIEKVIQEFNSPTGINQQAAYISLCAACQAIDKRPCSERTLNKILARRKSVHARAGKRIAYQEGQIVWYLHADEPIHGVRPFERVHFDHTLIELETYEPETNKRLGKVWLSLAIDAESRRILGFYISFEAPSYRSCMMLLRDIVRRHGRMPAMLILDNGKEFHSRALQRVCQLYGCILRYRPASKCRFGSVIERVFGTTQSQLIHQMEGNTKLMRNVRMITKSVMPENFIAWTLPALHGALDYYFNNIYGSQPHPAHGETPIDHFNRKLISTGSRCHRLVRYDETFRIETCPNPRDRDTRIVDNQRGVKVSHIWYWCEQLRQLPSNKIGVEVRIDPWDPGIVYILLDGRWQQCISKFKTLLKSLTEIELRYYLDSLARKYGITAKNYSPERIAEWIKVRDPKNFDPRIALQQREAKQIYEVLGMTSVNPLSCSAIRSYSNSSTIGSEKQVIQKCQSIDSRPGSGSRDFHVMEVKDLPLSSTQICETDLLEGDACEVYDFL